MLTSRIYSRRPAPIRPATNTATTLPAKPPIAGANPGAREALPVGVVAVVVPLVCVLSAVTRDVKLESEPKAAVTPLAFLQFEVE